MVGPLFWPYAYYDFVDYTFYPYGYDTFWPSAYDDLYESMFGPYAYGSAYAAVPPAGDRRGGRRAVRQPKDARSTQPTSAAHRPPA